MILFSFSVVLFDGWDLVVWWLGEKKRTAVSVFGRWWVSGLRVSCTALYELTGF